MSTLQEIGFSHDTDKATFHKYLDFYQKNLPGREFKGRLLEIGILQGSSLRMWREYYPKAEIVGIDIEDKQLDIPGVKQVIMDCKDIEALKDLGQFDIIIDDGSHMTLDQQLDFYWLYYNQLNKGGTYIIEDIHTSYNPQYVNSKYTTIEMVEKLNIKVVQYRRSEEEVDSMTTLIKAGQ
jgi:spermidine synthase